MPELQPRRADEKANGDRQSRVSTRYEGERHGPQKRAQSANCARGSSDWVVVSLLETIVDKQDNSGRSGRTLQPSFVALVEKIKQNDAHGLEELYRVLSCGARFYLCRQLGYQSLDEVHDLFVEIVKAIQQGDRRDLE